MLVKHGSTFSMPEFYNLVGNNQTLTSVCVGVDGDGCVVVLRLISTVGVVSELRSHGAFICCSRSTSDSLSILCISLLGVLFQCPFYLQLWYCGVVLWIATMTQICLQIANLLLYMQWNCRLTLLVCVLRISRTIAA